MTAKLCYVLFAAALVLGCKSSALPGSGNSQAGDPGAPAGPSPSPSPADNAADAGRRADEPGPTPTPHATPEPGCPTCGSGPDGGRAYTDARPPSPGVVECGSTSCSSTDVCCQPSATGVPKCQSPNEYCAGLQHACDEPADCPGGGGYCCEQLVPHPSGDGYFGRFRCLEAPACAAVNAFACHVDADCSGLPGAAAGFTRCCSTSLGGLTVSFCSAGPC